MRMKIIETTKAPGAIGPYSQGHIVNGLVYTSGQVPVNPYDGSIKDTIEEQTEQSCLNVKVILEEAGCSLEDVFKTTCFLSDMKNFSAFNEIYSKFFVSKPSRSCVAVRELPKGVLCEIEVIAVLPQQ